MRADRRVAWHIYLSITAELMPGLLDAATARGSVHEQFARLRAQLASMEGAQYDERLLVSADRAHMLYQLGDRGRSAQLLAMVARSLFILSATTGASNAPEEGPTDSGAGDPAV